MIKYICDVCNFETSNPIVSKESGHTIPCGWLTITGATIHNEVHNRKLMYAGKADFHFCSKRCFIDKFFHKEETTKP